MKTLLAVALYGALLALPVSAKHWHDDDSHRQKHIDHDDDDRDSDHRAANCYFEPRDVRVISGYYAPRYRSLPPGLQKKLARDGRLPPGWEKRMEPLPVVVERQLVPVPTGYSRGFIDGYAVVYNPRTQIVVDFTAVFGAH
jgi:hypothetical protein